MEQECRYLSQKKGREDKKEVTKRVPQSCVVSARQAARTAGEEGSGCGSRQGTGSALCPSSLEAACHVQQAEQDRGLHRQHSGQQAGW